MDNFRVIYRILRYLEKALDYDEPNMDCISAKALKLSDQRWVALMEMLSKEGYIDSFSVQRTVDGSILISSSTPRITLKGLEYLQENSLMKKAAELAKGVATSSPENRITYSKERWETTALYLPYRRSHFLRCQFQPFLAPPSRVQRDHRQRRKR